MATPESLRLFVAIPVPDAVKDILVRARDGLKSELGRDAVSWTRSGNMHLTLRFLGDVQAADARHLADGIEQSARAFGNLHLVCEGLGCFPHSRNPRVLWSGVRDAAGRLPELSRRITEATTAFTREPAESRFIGHITIGRVRQAGRPDVEIINSHLDRSSKGVFGRWTADEIQLIQSERTPAGSRYHVLHRCSLADGNSASATPS